MLKTNTIYIGDALKRLKTFPDNFFDCCVTSPPYYGLRDYGHADQIGLEETPELYVQKLVEIFREVRRVLKKEATCWLNLGDSYAGSGGASGQSPSATNFGKPRSERKYASEGITRDLKSINRAKDRTTNKWSYSKCPATGLLKPKDLIGIPWLVAFALRADGWWLRQDIIEEVELYCPCGCGYILEERIWRWSQDRDLIWKKPNPMPESVKDRPTKSHEYIFLLSKSAKYYYDYKAISEKSIWFESDKRSINGPTISARMEGSQYQCKKQGVYNKDGLRNKRSVWTVYTKPYKGAHFAVFPEELIIPCILAGCPENGIVLDPFIGSGTTAVVAKKLKRNYVGIELNSNYLPLIEQRLSQFEHKYQRNK